MHSFTVAQILDAAEQNKYPNFNDEYIKYDENGKPVQACVIGEAFLNLGLVENGTQAIQLSYALDAVKPDDGVIRIVTRDRWAGEIQEYAYSFDTLSTFINVLNSYTGWRGKKRLVKLARKYFSKSLDQVVEF